MTRPSYTENFLLIRLMLLVGISVCELTQEEMDVIIKTEYDETLAYFSTLSVGTEGGVG